MKSLALLCLWPLIARAATDARQEFQSVLAKVGDESPKVLAAQYEAYANKANELTNLLSWTPTVSAAASQSVTTTQSIAQYGAEGTQNGRIDLNLNLFRFGGDLSRFHEAQAAGDQARVKSQLAILNTENQAAQVVFQWIELQRRLDAQRTLLSSKRELARVAQVRFERGQLPQQESEKAHLDVVNSEVQIRQAEVQLLVLKGQLEAFLPGASDLHEWPWLAGARDGVKKDPLPVSERLGSRDLNLDRQIRDAKHDQALADWLPRLDFTATWLTNRVTPTIEKGEWSTFLTLSIPLWDRGQQLGSMRYWAQEKMVSEQNVEQYRRDETTRNTTLEERREKLRKNLIEILDSQEKAQKLADDSLKRFQLGRSSVNDLSIDQGRVFETESLAQSALRDYHLVLLESCLAADERPSRCF